MGLEPCPQYGKILDHLLDARLNGEIKTESEERRLATELANLERPVSSSE
jgi:tRNA nucleotidyltransferase (CCA-adding enzyme)